MNQIIEQISHIGIVPVIAIDEAEKAVPLARGTAFSASSIAMTGTMPMCEICSMI